jgi:hypothetical protein
VLRALRRFVGVRSIVDDVVVPPLSGPSPRLANALPEADHMRMFAHASGSELGGTGTTAWMGIVISLILIAFGAILTWAVNTDGGSVDPQVVGVILMVVGVLVFLISLVLWRTWWGAGFWAGPAYDDPAAPVVRRRVYRPARRRTTYIEEEPPPPAGPPAP